MRVGGLPVPSVAKVFEEQVRLPTKSGWPDHRERTAAPAESSLRGEDGVPRRVNVTRDIQIQIPVTVGVEERTSRAPTARCDASGGRHILERAVATITEQRVRPPVGHVEVESAVAIEITYAGTTSPRREIYARLLGDILEFPSSEVAIQNIAMRDAFARRRQLGTCDQVDVEQPITVVIEEGDAATGRFEDVILGGAAAIHLPRQLRTNLEGRWNRGAIFWRGFARRRRSHRRRVTARSEERRVGKE